VVSSLVPEQPADGEVHFVLCGFRSGPSYVETDPQAAARTDIVRNMIAGEYEHPLRVLAVEVAARSVRDVSVEIASAVQSAAAGRALPAGTQAFLAQYSPAVV
jgi:hypothetical protein